LASSDVVVPKMTRPLTLATAAGEKLEELDIVFVFFSFFET